MYEVLRAALQCAMAPGSERGAITITGKYWGRLRLDDQGITYRNFLRTHQISWDQVHWLTDGACPLEDAENWMLRIVLHGGREIRAAATEVPRPERKTLAAIRGAAAQHAVPTVLTGIPARRGQPRKAGRYVDPGGKLGLREWTGTEWSPHLLVDPASIGHAGSRPVSVWSPLPGARRISCRECGVVSYRATQVCAQCGAPLSPLSGL
jgi:hypothetical protein